MPARFQLGGLLPAGAIADHHRYAGGAGHTQIAVGVADQGAASGLHPQLGAETMHRPGGRFAGVVLSAPKGPLEAVLQVVALKKASDALLMVIADHGATQAGAVEAIQQDGESFGGAGRGCSSGAMEAIGLAEGVLGDGEGIGPTEAHLGEGRGRGDQVVVPGRNSGDATGMDAACAEAVGPLQQISEFAMSLR